MASVTANNKSTGVKGACGLAPETKGLESSNNKANNALAPKTAFHAVVTKVTSLWDNESTITYSFFGGTEHQKNAVDRTVQEWTWYANLNLQRVGDNTQDATVRIGFQTGGGSWSSVGKGARQVEKGKITMNLGWLEDSPQVSANDRGTILHEWGHALGLMHEHQSPARGGTLKLKEAEVLKYYRTTQGWSEPLIRSQILEKYNLDNVSNFSALDTKSIMMYFMPGYLNEQNITVHVNNELSDMDKAYMIINYPRRVPHYNARQYTLEWALNKAGVPEREQKEILAMGNADEIRLYFATWCKEARTKELEKLSGSNSEAELSQLLSSIYGNDSSGTSFGINASVSNAPSDVQQGLLSGLTGILKHPAFHKVVSTVVDAALTQRGINAGTSPAVPNGVQQGLLNDIGSLFGLGLNPQQAAAIAQNPDIQQGIFSGIANVLKHPVFQKVVHTAVNSALSQNGINPSVPATGVQQGLLSDVGHLFGLGLNPQQTATTAASQYSQANVQQGLLGDIGSLFGLGLNPQQAAAIAQNPNIQQGIFSGIANVLKHPVFQKVVHTAVNTALSQHGINPSAPAAGAQQGLFGLGLNPQQAAASTSQYSQTNVQQGLLGDIGSLFGLGLNPQQAAALAQNPDIQQGIFSGIVNVIKHPVFQKVVHTAVNSALSQHGINPSASVPMPAAGAQQGLLSDIGSLFGLGLNPQAGVATNHATQQNFHHSHHAHSHNAVQQLPAAGAQQGLISDIGSLFGLGLNPQQASASQYSQADVQQGLLGDLFGFGLNPQQTAAVASQYSQANGNVQQGLLGDIGSLFGLGLNPQQAAAVAQNPDIQQGIFSGIANVLKHPVFQKVVHTAVNSALSQHGINPSGPATVPSADAQQGLLSDIGSLFGFGLNPQTGSPTNYTAQPNSQYGHHHAHHHAHHGYHTHHAHHGVHQYNNTVGTYSDTMKPNAIGGFGTDDLQRAVYAAVESIVTQRGFQAPQVKVSGKVIDTDNLKSGDGSPTPITPPGSDTNLASEV